MFRSSLCVFLLRFAMSASVHCEALDSQGKEPELKPNIPMGEGGGNLSNSLHLDQQELKTKLATCRTANMYSGGYLVSLVSEKTTETQTNIFATVWEGHWNVTTFAKDEPVKIVLNRSKIGGCNIRFVQINKTPELKFEVAFIREPRSQRLYISVRGTPKARGLLGNLTCVGVSDEFNTMARDCRAKDLQVELN